MNKLDKVFIIDDDEIIIYLTEKIIKKSEFCDRFEMYTNVDSAINELRKNKDNKSELPEAILLDLNMPSKSGWDFIEEFKSLKLGVEIPIVVFTSSIDPKDRERSYQHREIKDFITKPLTVIKLDKILRLIDK